MIEFRILKQSKRSCARLGMLKTPHGEVETPALVPVATQAVVKTLTSEEAAAAGCHILIANTFHLHLKPGETVVKRAGGLHRFMNWKRPLMTDSGGFQVFSLGFGKDHGVGKLTGYFARERGQTRTGTRTNAETTTRKLPVISASEQPSSVRITEQGVFFQSPGDGRKLFLGPRESMRIQEALGADIMFAFDECTPPGATRAYIEKSLARTHRWAKQSLDAFHSASASRRATSSGAGLFGIVQGSTHRDLREQSARFINELGFDGFGIGGDLGKSKADMKRVLDWTIPLLDPQKPRHLLGIGHPEDLEPVVKAGIDLFDCTAPTHYARRGIAFTSHGRLHLDAAHFLKEQKPLDPKCSCEVCKTYTRSYICHLLRAKEITALRLLTFHNLSFFNKLVERIREHIGRGAL